MTKEIQLTKGYVAIVDDDDFGELSKNKWCYLNGYAVRGISIKNKSHTVFMHRQINKTPEGMSTDHVDGNKLNNKKENLRTCTESENKRNAKTPKTNKSGYKGVSFSSSHKKWYAIIKNNGKSLWIGGYDNKTDAAIAYDKKAIELYGEFARLNFPLVQGVVLFKDYYGRKYKT